MSAPLPVFSHDGDHEPLATVTTDQAVARVYRVGDEFVLTGKTDDDPNEYEFHKFGSYPEAMRIVAQIVEMDSAPVLIVQL